MALVTSKEMFQKAYEGGYAIGAFNVNNMEIIQGITEAAKEENAPLILQVSSGARNYAKHVYFNMKKAWSDIIARGMNTDYSWNKSARKYEQLYDKVLGW